MHYKELAILFVILIFFITLSLMVGEISLNIIDIKNAFIGKGEFIKKNILWNLRLPRTLLALLVGGNLAIAGSILQSYFHNPLAEPHIIGISAGSALGATIYFIFSGGTWEIDPLITPWISILGAFIVLFILILWNRKSLYNSSLILLGVSLNALLSSLISFLLFKNQKIFQGVYFWILGGFNGKGWQHLKILFTYSLISLPWAYLWRKRFNLLNLTEEEAYSLGLSIRKYQKYFLILISLLIAPSVSVSGIIGFVGLIAPHIMRLWKTSDFQWLIPSSFLFGGILLLLSDILARTVLYPAEIPIGIITSFLGVPFFIFLLRKEE
ncbi:MAG: iron ABC transporter permease [Dictyoglomaceae bacterium]|nr:iron ABC transporter permease [Dictyoglomaceae bacterium]